jgi:tetratricopeptide (TPR) repeat protein
LLAGCARAPEEGPHRENLEISRAIAALGPAVVESSAPISPEWVMRSSGSTGELMFVGQSTAPSLDTAKARAERDLLAAISSYVSVDVEADMQDVSWSNNGNEGQSIKSTVKTKTSAALREIQPDAYYWERVAPSPLAIDSANYQYYSRASVSRAEIARARLSKQNTRRADSGRRVIALLPFRGVGSSSIAADLVARGLYEETGRLLARSAELHLVEESVVRAVLAGSTREAEQNERIMGALLPERLLRAQVQLHQGRLRVSARLEDAAGRNEDIVLLRPKSALPTLAAELSRAVFTKLGAKVTAQVPAPRNERGGDEEVLRAYVEAGIKLQSGALEEALQLAKKTIELSPKHAPAHLRLGRILERMGRFAKIPPTQASPYSVQYLSLCTPEAQLADHQARVALNTRAAQLSSGTASQPSWWVAEAPFADTVLDSVLNSLEAQIPPPPPSGIQSHSFDTAPEWLQLPKVRVVAEIAPPAVLFPSSAVEAYAAAVKLFLEQKDKRGEVEAELAVADLASRIDRPDYALYIYRLVLNWADKARDPHFSSLAHYGRAMVHRKRGYFGAARQELLAALYDRAKLGEKPYILEIYNELGSVALSLSEQDAAEALYRHALRIAEEMSSDYLRAVLANNLGAVEWSRGHTADATDRFQRAADKLTDLRESEGRIAATLNLAAAFDLRTDLDQATLLYTEIDRLVKQTQQEGRIAELSLHRGAFELHRGNTASGYEAFASSFHLSQRIGKNAESMRARDAIYAGEYYSKGQDRQALLRCMKGRYWGLDAAVFEPEEVIDGETEPPANVLTSPHIPERELILALDAAAVLALDPWTPDYDRTVVFAEPATTPPPEVDPRAAARARNEREKQLRDYADRIQREPTITDDKATSVRPSQQMEVEITATDSNEEALGSAVGGAISDAFSEPQRQKVQVAKSVDYERILGAFTVNADVVLLLDPATVERYAVGRLLASARRAFAALKVAFERRGAKRLFAACELNDAALAWVEGDAEAAYRGFVAAERAFAGAGENRGLAQAHAWLAHVFQTSGEEEIALEHRLVAEHLFSRIAPR